MGEHPRPIATVDMVTLRLSEDGVLTVGVLRRTEPDEPFCGALALPGGFVHVDDEAKLLNTAHRVIHGKTGTIPAYVEQLDTRGDATRDPRGWSLSVSYLVLVSPFAPSRLEYYPVAAPPQLAFDHATILTSGLRRLYRKATYSALPLALLPPSFTMAQARWVYELLTQQRIDAASFRRKLLERDVIEECGERQGVGPPSTLYRRRPGAEVTFRRAIVG